MELNVDFLSNGQLIIKNFDNPWNIRQLWCSNYFDINLVKQYLGNDINTIIEFGSYDGGDGIRYKYFFPNANIYSIEPSPSCYRNILPLKKYGLNIFNYAISDENTIKTLYETYDPNYLNYAPCSSLNKECCSVEINDAENLEIKEPINVETKKLKTFCEEQNINSIDLLHIDVEGHMCEVINGMDDLNVKMIFIEVKSDTHNYSDKVDILLTKKKFRKITSYCSDQVWIKI